MEISCFSDKILIDILFFRKKCWSTLEISLKIVLSLVGAHKFITTFFLKMRSTLKIKYGDKKLKNSKN